MSSRPATHLFPFSALAFADRIILVVGSFCGVAGVAGVNSLDTWLGTVVGTTIQSCLADGIPGVDESHPP